MTDNREWPSTAAIFGASGGVGNALCRQLQSRGVARIYAGSRRNPGTLGDGIVPFQFDLTQENTLVQATQSMVKAPPELVIVSTGALTLSDGTGPEKSLRALNAGHMAEAFAVNTIGPALIAKHILPLIPRQGRAIFAVLSARVGSIEDNRLGGWHSYRASKAALNMLMRNFAIEMSRTRKEAIVVALHPGTVDTGLSEPFQSNVPDKQLATPNEAACNLLNVLGKLTPADTGKFFAWDGKPIAF
ncbi:SDR family NAD(P)-dependent oxidoreductase [Altererythrobacter indicus]|uniref:SDR family NAD(P)-dependent oxidoreductase n=1 Tax=Altericroceibacterium indicum TaxID=374177 RepID=A0A845A951_9SPHN|nr:SDR family NAD(P)-dependent oxidoreductase [Altericroceibacterium indicum]MXP25325.1 SDR family NAD(P)-dependent oxidoreductase [Altericroceibacterium indicum]